MGAQFFDKMVCGPPGGGEGAGTHYSKKFNNVKTQKCSKDQWLKFSNSMEND